MEKPRFVVADTMDLWIETTRADLDALLPRVDLLILNDSEAREMTKETSLIKAGRRIRDAGPKYVAIKKGEHGALLFGETSSSAAARIRSRTSTIRREQGTPSPGGMAGYLAAAGGELNFTAFRRAMIYGSVLASFNVEAFSLERMRSLTKKEIEERYQVFRSMSQFEVVA
jgi:hypothetical protein